MNHRFLVINSSVFILLAVAGAWIHWALIPSKVSTLNQLQNHADTLQVRLKADRRYVSDHSMIESGGIGTLIEQLTHDLNELKIEDRSLSTDTRSQNDALHQIPLKLSFKSTLSNVAELLDRLDKYECAIHAEKLLVEREVSSRPGTVSVSVRLDAFLNDSLENVR